MEISRFEHSFSQSTSYHGLGWTSLDNLLGDYPMNVLKSRADAPVPQIKAYDYVLTFGKHKGETVEDVIESDPGYILWLQESGTAKVDREILDVAEESDRYDNGHLHDIGNSVPDPWDIEIFGFDIWD